MAGFTPFTPGTSPSAALAATVATSNATLPAGTGRILLLQNDGTATVFFKLGAAAVVATITDAPILAGAIFAITPGDAATTIAGITGTGSSTLRVTRGDGI